MKDTEKFISCDCHGHGILVDYIIDEDSSELFMMMFGDWGYFQKPSLWYRIKTAWRILRKGDIYGGELCLNEDKVASLVAYLQNFLIKAES